MASASEKGNGEAGEEKRYGKIIDAVISLLKDQYIDDIKDDIYKEALNGIMSSLDPHSAFFTEKEFAEMRMQTKGEFGGLGIVVTKDNLNLIKIISPIDNTPASRAGVLAGDYISEINGETTYNMSLNDAVERMRGKVGERVKIVILRNGADKPIELTLKREIIKTQSVKGEMRDDNILYMRITNFIETTGDDFLKTFNKIVLENKNKKINGVALDLRNNPGGLLNQAVRISEFFLEKGKTIVLIKGKNQVLLDEFKSTAGKQILDSGTPVVVLVNGGSASASEIVAGALQDHKRAIVLGETTFGKASVQQIFPMNDGSALKITIARYYTPNGRSLQLDGIVPDIIVKDAEVKYSENSFNLREENLKGRLDRAPVDIITKTLNERREKEKKKNEKADETADYQLSRALDLIRGINVFSGNGNDADAKENN
ncbi:MAG: S41 family peptidase [Rickettsiales bacterium]|jgi:carboxyl-terminal processing protease|nr:S41 family peptidase [Rickettsiales bacterium]